MAGGRRKQMAEINVVPYIDVMLVLLIIFMVTAPLLKQGVEVDLPQTANQPVPPSQEEPLIVSLNDKGELFLNVGERPDDPLALAAIQGLVVKVLKAKPQTPVMVAGDHTIEYGKVVQIMTALQQAGAEKVGLLTEPPESL